MLTKVVRRAVIPDVKVTIGSKFFVYHLHTTDPATNGKWALYEHATRLAVYDTSAQANAAKRELQDRREDQILNLKPRMNAEVAV